MKTIRLGFLVPPVLSGASAMMWHALKTAKAGARIAGYGSLLSN